MRLITSLRQRLRRARSEGGWVLVATIAFVLVGTLVVTALAASAQHAVGVTAREANAAVARAAAEAGLSLAKTRVQANACTTTLTDGKASVTVRFREAQPANWSSVAASCPPNAEAPGFIHITSKATVGGQSRTVQAVLYHSKVIGVAQVAAGRNSVGAGGFIVAVDGDGIVYTAGESTFGALGKASLVQSPALQPVSMPVGVRFTQVAAGMDFALALATDGSVYGWGRNLAGALGTASVGGSVTVPTKIALPSSAKAAFVAAGDSFSVFVTTTGAVYTVGENTSGQLGNGLTTSTSAPQLVSSLSSVKISRVAAGSAHVIALTTEGAVRTWGLNSSGQLGDGTTTSRSLPIEPDSPISGSATRVSAGKNFTAGLSTSGRLYTWGAASDGQLCTGGTANQLNPVLVTTPEGKQLTRISAGEAHLLATDKSGAVYGCGDNAFAQLGVTSTADQKSMVASTALSSVKSSTVVAGRGLSIAIDGDSAAFSIGSNEGGQASVASNASKIAEPRLMVYDNGDITGAG